MSDSFLNSMNSINEFIYSLILNVWNVITTHEILLLSFSLFLVALVFAFFRKIRKIHN